MVEKKSQEVAQKGLGLVLDNFLCFRIFLGRAAAALAASLLGQRRHQHDGTAQQHHSAHEEVSFPEKSEKPCHSCIGAAENEP